MKDESALLPVYNKINNLMDEACEQLGKKLEAARLKQVQIALEKNGQTFNSLPELKDFLEAWCSIQANGYHYTLFAKGNPVCTWDDTPEYKMEGNSLTATFGEFKIIYNS